MSGGRHAAPDFGEGGSNADKPAIRAPHMHARKRFVTDDPGPSAASSASATSTQANESDPSRP